jgi:hypothetical protein
MGVVVGVDEAEQTPQTVTQTSPAPTHTAPEPEQTPGFGERGRMRRRARFLRKARELAYRDLGGLVFDLHRFGQRNDTVVMVKLATLKQIDSELRSLEAALRDRRPVTVLREVGIGACPRCAAIHGSDDRFCPGCGLAFDTNAERPIATAPVVAPPAPAPATTPMPAPSTSAVPSPPPVRSGPGMGRSAPSPPPVQPTAAPFPAKPAVAESPKPKPQDEDEPTQILRPPATGA